MHSGFWRRHYESCWKEACFLSWVFGVSCVGPDVKQIVIKVEVRMMQGFIFLKACFRAGRFLGGGVYVLGVFLGQACTQGGVLSMGVTAGEWRPGTSPADDDMISRRWVPGGMVCSYHCVPQDMTQFDTSISLWLQSVR